MLGPRSLSAWPDVRVPRVPRAGLTLRPHLEPEYFSVGPGGRSFEPSLSGFSR